MEARRPYRIAIIGASFSGLTVARALQRRLPNDAQEVVVFERYDQSCYINNVNGGLEMHGLAESLLASLGLKHVFGGLDCCGVAQTIVPRSQLLRGLFDSLLPGTVQNGFRVTGVANTTDGCLALVLQEKTPHKVPFDCVVLACGITTLASIEIPAQIAHRVAVVGDARIQKGYELFFGYQRITSGAGDAMADALAFTEVFAKGDRPTFLAEYSVSHWKRARRIRGVAFAVCLLLLLAAVVWAFRI
jgi:hypothetical protein